MGKCHLKIRYHKRRLCLKNDHVMNMALEHHEYKGFHSEIFFEGGASNLVICISPV